MIAEELVRGIVVAKSGDVAERPLIHALAPVVMTAIRHDLDEVLTGDIPSPLKPAPDPRALSDIQLVVKVADYIESVSWADSWVHDSMRTSVMDHYRDRWGPVVAELDRRYPKSREMALELLENLCRGRIGYGGIF